MSGKSCYVTKPDKLHISLSLTFNDGSTAYAINAPNNAKIMNSTIIRAVVYPRPYQLSQLLLACNIWEKKSQLCIHWACVMLSSHKKI